MHSLDHRNLIRLYGVVLSHPMKMVSVGDRGCLQFLRDGMSKARLGPYPRSSTGIPTGAQEGWKPAQRGCPWPN